MNKKLSFLALLFTVISISVSRADNPIVQTNYTADPAPMVHNGTVYLYTTHDEDKTINNFFTMNDWRCYSSTDMVNWTDHGSVLSYTDFAWSRGDAWAGQCIYRNGKFYFYVPVNMKNGGTAIGVAVSDSPTGPFKDALGKPLLIGSGYIDPTVFIDDDNQAYLYWGNPDLWYVKLNEDMISYNSTVGVVKTPLTVSGFGARNNSSDRITSYEEGPWFFKRNNKYYLLYPAGGVPEVLAYSTSPSPTGPWTYGNIIMNQIADKGAFTNHPGYIDYKGKSYLFYHNAALPGGGGYKRSVCVDEFQFNNDGSISLITPTSGVQTAVENVNPYRENQAETMAWEEGIETAKSEKAGIYVTDIDNGDYIKVRSVDFGQAGAAAFSASVACETGAGITGGGTIEVRLDSRSGLLVGSLPVTYTGGTNEWLNETTNISGATGVHDVYFVFKSATNDVFNLDKWIFTPKSTTKELIAVNATTEKYKIDTISAKNISNIKVLAIYSDGSSSDVTSQAAYSFQQGGLVTITNGVIKGTAYGTENVKVSYGGMTDELKLIVKNLDSELTVNRLLIQPGNLDILCGTTSPIVITAEYFDGHTENVTNLATISNPSPQIATISNGLITAQSKGVVTISADFRGKIGVSKSGTIAVNVYNRSPYIKNEIEDYSDQSGIQSEDCSDIDGGKNIGFIENGDWVMIKALDFDKGGAKFEARISSASSGGFIEIHLNSLSGTLIGKCPVTNTGSWQTWVTETCAIDNIKGINDIYLVFKGGSGYLFNMNWWKFYPNPTSVIDSKNEVIPAVVSKNGQKYLVNMIPADVVILYNSLGQEIKSFKVISTEEPLTGNSGTVIIKIRRGGKLYTLKTVLKRP